LAPKGEKKGARNGNAKGSWEWGNMGVLIGRKGAKKGGWVEKKNF